MSPTSATRHLHRETLTPSAITDEEIRSLARFLQHTPSGSPVEPAYLCSPGGERVSIPARLYPLMETLLEALVQGRGISVVPADTQLTTQQAADYLGVSRPTLVKLLERGEIPFTKAGRHRRVLLNDLVAYEQEQERRRQEALAAMTREAADEGDYFARPADARTR
ncbi:helix-turn-helix domain-containing protein [Rothia kristinae]|uniref:Helix-turn-helix domain-containing protein n=1 Tax=Rothia kristinae TaxID=37923 RepID=A0A7T4T597_9MICC|nr:helix-turn-helix domain-containing protein [Rothia kristinae]QQC60319.1 helix-turn-helix domain-containing protein [Rothia kristinae]